MPGTNAPLFFMLSAVSLLWNTSAVQKKQKKTISEAYRNMYSGCPGDNAAARSRIQRVASPVVNQLASVAGNRISDDAKIGGITPDMLSLSGRNELWPP